MKQTMTNLKGEIKISTIIFGDFKTLSIMVEHIERSIRTESSWKTLNITQSKIYRIFTAKYTEYSSEHECSPG